MSAPGYLSASALRHLVGYGEFPFMVAATSTAYMYERLHREGVRTGHSVGVATPGGAYRSYANAVDIQRQWLGKSHAINWHLNPGSGAMPSLHSVHMQGRCLDFVGNVGWVKQVAEEYGVTFPLVYLGDTNHGQHDGTTRGNTGLYPYEWKRLQRFLGVPVTGKKSAAYSKALKARVAKDGRNGMSLRSHWSHYLDLEAAAHAKAA